jgi:hypothetical protein
MRSKWIQNRPKPFKIIKQMSQIGKNPTQIKQNVILDGFVGSWSARLVPGRSGPKAPNKTTPPFSPFWPKMAARWLILGAILSQNLSKNNAKIDTKIDAEKVSKMMPK